MFHIYNVLFIIFLSFLVSLISSSIFNVSGYILSLFLFLIAWMHSTARRCGYPSVSIRAAREPARGAAGEQSLANTVFRRRRPTTSPPPPGPAASVAGAPPARTVGRAGWDPPPPPLPAAAAGRARCHPPGSRWVAWRIGLTADRFRVTGQAGRAPPSLILGVSWAARWCAGSPELCTSLSAEPVGQSAGFVRMGCSCRGSATACGPPAGPTRTRRTASGP
jgi:hypothetical protein